MNFTSLFTAINKMAQKYNMPILYSCHPRSRNRLESSGFQLDSWVIRHEPLGFHDYNCLQMNAFAVVSDSGTLPEESNFFTSIGRSCAFALLPSAPKLWIKAALSWRVLKKRAFCRPWISLWRWLKTVMTASPFPTTWRRMCPPR